MSTTSAEAELQRKNERLGLLLNLTTAIASSLDLREVLRAIAGNIRAVMHADAVTVWLPDAASGKFKVFALDFPHGKGVIKEESLVTLSAGAKKAMATLKPVIVDIRQGDEFASATSELATAEGIKALCGIPLVNRGRVIGILSAGRTTEIPFIAEDVDFFSQASGLIAIAIENALAYQELKEREAKIRRLVDANIIGICIWNVEGNIINANEAFLKMVGYGRELFESTSMRWTEMTPPEWLENDARILAELRVKGTAPIFEKELFRKDGSRVPVLLAAALFEEGGSEGVAFVLDLSQQKQAEEELHRNEMELRQVLDLTPQHVAVLGGHRERLYANRNFLDYLGLSLEEWRQRSDGGYFAHPDDWERINRYFAHVDHLSSGAGFEFEVRLPKGDGSYRWFLARCNPLRDDKGQIVRWYIAATDIEDRKRAEERLQQENVALREEIVKTSMFEEIVGTSAPLKKVLSRISKVASTDSSVLITGETGTGKELVARAIHRRSSRSAQAFVSVNCAAIPRDLIASELFGHEKGAFTGATQRRLGRFELAEKGTIFLDEIGELSADTQVALLRVLQEHEFERVGGVSSIRIDVRVIAATNRDLEAAIAAGTFRSDLFYRLNVFPIEVPSLRERKEDIPLLVEYFVDRYARKAGKVFRGLNRKSLDLLQAYPWPGNIRELQNVIERSVIVCETENFLVDESWLSRQPLVVEPDSRPNLFKKVPSQEKALIEAALSESGGRVYGPSGAASRLGIPRSTLESKIRSLKINKNRFKGTEPSKTN